VKKVANNSSLLSKLLSFKRDESGMTIILIAILLPVLISAVNLSVLTQGTNFSIFFS
jgi:Flp pilus assembly protein TadG